MKNISKEGGMLINPHLFGKKFCEPKIIIEQKAFNSWVSRASCSLCRCKNLSFTKEKPSENDFSRKYPDNYPETFNRKYTEFN